jgi:hypothetical protein
MVIPADDAQLHKIEIQSEDLKQMEDETKEQKQNSDEEVATEGTKLRDLIRSDCIDMFLKVLLPLLTHTG